LAFCPKVRNAANSKRKKRKGSTFCLQYGFLQENRYLINTIPLRYKSLKQSVNDLERNGMLVRISAEINPYLEMAEIQRRA
jgi:hypothetical protein